MPGSPALATSVGGAASPVARHRPVEPPDPALERRDDVRPGREHVGVVPVGVEQDPDDRPVRVEVAGVLVGLDDGRPALAQPDDGRRGTGELRRQDGPDEGRRVEPGPDEQVDEPAGRRRLAVGPGDRQQVTAAGRDRVGDELLAADGRDPERMGRVELGLVRIDRGQRLRDGDPVDERLAPAGSTTWSMVVAPDDRDAGCLGGRRCSGVGSPGVTAADLGSGGAGTGVSAAEAAEPAAPRTWIALTGGDRTGRPGRLEAAGDLLDAAGHQPAARPGSTGGRGGRRRASASAASMSSSRAAPALAIACSPPGRPSRRTDGPRRRPGRRGRGTSARPAWRRDRRRGRRSPSPTPRTSRSSRSRAPRRHRAATWALTAPWAAMTLGRDAELSLLDRVGVGDDPAEDVAARPGHVGQRVGDEPAGARLGGDDRPATGDAEAWSRSASAPEVGVGLLVDRSAVHRRPAPQRWFVCSGLSGGCEQPGLRVARIARACRSPSRSA